MEIQRLLGSDIVMAFDECPALPASEDAGGGDRCGLDALGGAVARRVRRPAGAALFGIQQGGVHRASCARSRRRR